MTIGRPSPEFLALLLEHARANADKIGVPMCFTVVDEAGHVVEISRMPDAGWATVDLSRGKATVAAAFGKPTADLANGWANASLFTTALIVAGGGDFVPAPGGLPIRAQGQAVGAIGASGGTGAQDTDVVTTALAAAEAAMATV